MRLAMGQALTNGICLMSSVTEKTLNRGANHAEILEQVGVAVITINAMGKILHTNSATVEMFGYSESCMHGQNVSMLMPEHDRVRHDGYLQEYIRTGENRIIGKGREVEGRRADSSIFPMHLAVGRFENDGQIYFTGIVHDLTIQDLAKDQASRFGRIIDDSINEIFVFSAETLKFTLANSGARNNLGYSMQELLLMTPVDIKPDYTVESFRELIAPLSHGETDRLNFQTTHQRKDGTHYNADVVLHLSDAVMPPEFVAIVQDCTERNAMLAAVQQSQKMDSIGQLTGGIAHDFNNLLTVITGNLELLEMSTKDPDSLELIEEAISASALGANLISRLLSFARRSTLVPTRLNLNDVILDILDLLKRGVGESISFHTILEPGIWPVKLDQSQLDSALMNLVINARDAMSGNGNLTIRSSNRALSTTDAEAFNLPAGNYAVISITDTGSGICKKDFNHVFEPFYTTKSKSRGHGLGLSMVYGFARQSGGHIFVESEVGIGACFTMLLPRDWHSNVEKEQESDNYQHVVDGARILLVEDDDSVRRLTLRRLRHMGHSVVEASSAAEALDKYREHSDFDLIFTDMVMPGTLNGLQLAQLIHKLQSDMPIIISSGYSEQLAGTDDMNELGLTVLHKPYTLESLAQTVSKALDTNQQL